MLKITRRQLLFIIILLTIIPTSLWPTAENVRAANFVVTKTADTNDGTCNADCSLREAVVAANASAGPDTITFAVNGTFSLTLTGSGENAAATGDLDITDDLTITGNGLANTIIDGNNSDRILDLINTVSPNTRTVNLTGVTIQNGLAPAGIAEIGGGIRIGATNNTSTGVTTLNITNSRIDSNDTQSSNGAGIGITKNVSGATPALTLDNTTISGNTVGGTNNSGGINCGGCTLTMTNSTISGNTSPGSSGSGGILISGNTSLINITNSTISGNTASGGPGGGINLVVGTGTINLTNVTIANNSGTSAGGVNNTSGTLNATNTLITNNTGGNVGGTNGLNGTNTTNITIDVAGLGPLANNGGNTQTHSIPNSIGAGLPLNAGTNNALPNDQRGPLFSRIVDGTIDIGALELTLPEIAVSEPGAGNIPDGGSFSFGSTTVGNPIIRTFTVTNSGSHPLNLANLTVPAGFSIISNFGSTSVPAGGGTTTFQVSLVATSPGAFNGTLSFDNNDINETPFNFTLNGTVTLPAPEMGVLGNNTTITDGDTTPSLTDHTDFGSVAVGGAITRTFTISNSGTADLNLTGVPRVSLTGSAAGDFSVVNQPATPVISNTSTTFQVRFDPTVAGTRVATVTIANNDSNENPYDFAIQGVGTIPTVQFSQAAPYSSNESAVTSTAVTLTRSGDTSFASTVQVTITGGSASGSGTDYDDSSFPLTVAFDPGETSQSVPVPLTDDLLDENTEDITFQVTAISNAAIGATNTATLNIIDNDSPPALLVNNVTVTEGTGGTVNAVFSVTLSAASGLPISVDYSTANNTATAPADYTAIATQTLNFAPGVTTRTITVTVQSDTLDEPDETFFVNLGNPSNATITDGQGIGTITDDDLAPNLTVNDVTVNEGAGTTTFTVSLSGASGRTVSVDYATANGTATAGSDYTAINTTTLTIPAGDLTGTLTVNITNDTLDENNETLFVNLANAVNATITDGQGVGTITDNDNPPNLTIDDVTVNEGDGTATFTVSLSTLSGLEVEVDYATSNGTATAGSDYTALSTTTLTIPAGDLTGTLTVNITNDTLDENSETFFVNLADAVNGVITDDQGVGTITDNDGPPNLSIDDVTVNENDGTATFTVSLSTVSGQTVSVDYGTANGTATAGSDYTAISTTTLTIPAGDLTGTLTVNITNDTLDENSETFFVNLADAVNGAITDDQGIGTITDNDNPPNLSIDDVTVNEGDGTATFTVSLNTLSGLEAEVDYATSNGTAIAGSDYTAVNTTTLTIPAGDLTGTLSVAITDDSLDENSETFFVNLANAVNAVITDGQGLGTITDNDSPPNLTIDNVTVAEDNGTATFTISLNTVSGLNVEVDYATDNNTAIAGSDYTAINTTTLTIPAGDLTGTLSVAITNDSLDENNETFFVNLADAVNGTITDGQGLGTITDNDSPPNLTVDNVTVDENDGTATFTVSLNTISGLNVDVDYATADGTATAGSDYTSISTTTLTIPAGDLTGTLSVAITDDNLDENNETFFVNLANAVNGTITDGQGVGTITDDDNAPNLTIDDVTVNENDGTATFTISLSTLSGLNVDVDYATANGTATAGSDYTAVNTTTLTIPAGDLTGTLSVAITDDGLDENSETFFVNLADAVNGVITDDQGVGTITDNDNAPNLTIDDVTVNENDGTATFTVNLSTLSGLNVEVDYATGNGAATAGSDYTAINTTTLTIPAGNLTETLTVNIINDAVDENDETFFANLADAVNGVITDDQGVGTITDDDTADFSVKPVTLTLSEPNSTDVFNISLTSQPTADVVIGLSTVSDECSFPASVTLTSLNWNNGVTVTVTAQDDFVTDGPQTCIIVTAPDTTTSDSNYNGLDPADVTVTVNDDDVPGIAISPTGGLTTTEAGGTAAFTIRLRTQPTAPVTLTLTSSDPGEGSASPAPLVFTTANWNISQTVTIAGVNDAIDDGNQPYLIITNDPTSSDADYNGAGANPADVAVTNLDDDIAGFVVSSISGNTGEAGLSATFTLALASQPTATVTIPVTSSDPTEGAASPSSLSFTPLNWNAPQTVTVTGVDDPDTDGSVGYTIQTGPASSSDPAYNGLNPNDVAVVNDDNDAEAGVLYLPLILRKAASAPDLVIDSLVATSSGATVVIRNRGNAPVTDAFWVDVYFNPTSIPTLNKPWQVIASHGQVWGVQGAALPLDPGESLTLTTGDAYYFPNFSSTPPLPTGANVFAQVDSVDFSSSFGAVQESNESNNLRGPAVSTVSTASEIASSQGGPASAAGLPARE